MKKFILSAFLFVFFSLTIFAEDINEIVILQTTDMHSHIFGKEAGWLRVASEIKKFRQSAGGKDNILLIDCGDTLSGSISGVVSNGKAAATLLNSLEYDAWIIGNHDFELGTARLSELCYFIKADKLAGNLQWQEKQILPYQIYHKNGIKIALIGLTSPHLKKWLWGDDTEKFKVSSLIESIDKIMPQVMAETPDMIILSTHHGRYCPKRLQGINISRITEKYPQIDLVLGGHSHQQSPGEKNGLNSWFALAGPHGSSLAIIKVRFDSRTKKVIELKSQLVPISGKTPLDIPSLRQVKQWQVAIEDFQNQNIGWTKRRISGAVLDKFFAKAMILSSDADAAFICRPVYGVEFHRNITGKDLFAVEPYDDTVCTLWLSQDDIQAIIAEQDRKKGMGRYQAFFNEKKNTVKGRRISVAFSSYVLAGAGGRFPVLKAIGAKPDCHGKNTGVSIRQALCDFIKENY